MGGERPVLVLTHEFDPTADMVVDQLNQRGAPVFRCNPGAFPERLTLAATVGRGWTGCLGLPERELRLDQVGCVYYRRPTVFELPDGLSDAERGWALREARAGFGGVIAALPRWLNHPHDMAYAGYKPVQLHTAAACGLRVPETLITNDPHAAAEFARIVGRVVYKPMAQNGIAEDGRYRLLFATVLDDELDEPTIRSTAHLFQQFVTQQYAVRLTAIDDCLLAARIDAHSPAAALDWRTDYAHLTYRVITVPHSVRDAVLALMRALRLRFGALDFIVTPADDWIFLEINPKWTVGLDRGQHRPANRRYHRRRPHQGVAAVPPPDAAQLRRDLVDTLDDLQVLHTAAWRNAFLDVPRETFLPRFFRPVDGRHESIDSTHPEWLNLVYRNAVWPTQLDGDSTAWDRARRDRPIVGEPTCSSTMPSLMALMLECLHITDAHTVLEIGTGTGYNAALLSHRLGHDNVTSIDIDPVLVDAARQQLVSCGYWPTVIAGDGAVGHPDRAPYDRLIATCSVPTIPAAWLKQLRPGGKLITHLYRDLGGGALVQLNVDGPTSAHGHFLADYGNFMPTRQFNRATTTDLFRYAVRQQGRTRPVVLDPGLPVADDSQPFVLLAALHMPGTHRLEFQPSGAGPQVWLLHRDGSWAVHDIDTHTVEQGGDLQLWDTLEGIYRHWTSAGKPARERFGLAITEHHEWLWLDEPTNQNNWHCLANDE